MLDVLTSIRVKKPIANHLRDSTPNHEKYKVVQFFPV